MRVLLYRNLNQAAEEMARHVVYLMSVHRPVEITVHMTEDARRTGARIMDAGFDFKEIGPYAENIIISAARTPQLFVDSLRHTKGKDSCVSNPSPYTKHARPHEEHHEFLVYHSRRRRGADDMRRGTRLGHQDFGKHLWRP